MAAALLRDVAYVRWNTRCGGVRRDCSRISVAYVVRSYLLLQFNLQTSAGKRAELTAAVWDLLWIVKWQRLRKKQSCPVLIYHRLDTSHECQIIFNIHHTFYINAPGFELIAVGHTRYLQSHFMWWQKLLTSNFLHMPHHMWWDCAKQQVNFIQFSNQFPCLISRIR
jgi:hypothetical protein